VSDNLDKLCYYFDCDIEKLVTHIKESREEEAAGDV